MRMNLQSVEDGAERLPEGDPLPPHDRVVGRQETQSLDQLYRARAPWLLRFFSRRAPADEAHDLLQETFTRMATAGATRDIQIARPAAYLGRIARNLIRDRTKMRIRRSADLHISVDDAILTAPDQQRALEARDMLNRLEQAMLKLNPKTREIFLAHRLDGYSYAEIAVRTGLSVKGVEKQMSRAIAHLDRLLSDR